MRARAPQISRPEPDVPVPDVQHDALDAPAVRPRGRPVEHVGVGGVREGERVGGVEHGRGFEVDGVRGAEQGGREGVGLCLGGDGPGDAVGGGEGVGVDFVAEFAGEAEEDGGLGDGAGGGGGGVARRGGGGGERRAECCCCCCCCGGGGRGWRGGRLAARHRGMLEVVSAVVVCVAGMFS